MRRRIEAWMDRNDAYAFGVAIDLVLAVLVAAVATESLRSLFAYP